MERFYFDYAATTPLDPRVLTAMQPYFSEKFGNPSSLHFFGQEAITAIDHSRETISKAINADFREIIFTGSATEANNLILRGTARAWQKMNQQSERPLSLKIHHSFKKPRIIVSAIEHESILETARDLGENGLEIIHLPVNKNGFVDLEVFKNTLNEETILVSVMYANNEIGTIQSIAEISKIIKDFRHSRSVYPIFHTDAVQAFQFLGCDVKELNVDSMTLSAHKLYGPKGIGALYLHQSSPVRRIITGGDQEFGFRSGTENVPAIVGFGKAAELALENREKERERIAELRDYFWKGFKKAYSRAQINVEPAPDGPKTKSINSAILPNILNVYFPDYPADELLTRMDLSGVAASSGSACSSRASEPSYVIQALGHSRERAKKSLRFSFGRPTDQNEVDKALKIIKKIFDTSKNRE